MTRRALLAGLMTVALISGCAGTTEPAQDAREALGTVVSITAYTSEGDATSTIDEAYGVMDETSAALDVYGEQAQASAEETATAASLNADPHEWRTLPDDAVAIVSRAGALGLGEAYSSRLYGVQALYQFEEGGVVPDPAALEAALAAANSYETTAAGDRVDARFLATEGLIPDALEGTMLLTEASVTVGVDYGGASKGLALQRAVDVLSDGGVEAGVVSAGSTTIAFGRKPDETEWRIGIEDPRDPEKIIAVIESAEGITVSTSGDYQRYFEEGGVRYHHILDPATGTPVRGIRSLTVIGAPDGMDSDILSTALFVLGIEKASAYAQDHALGLYIVDAEGQTHVVPGPDDAWSISDPE